MADQTPRSFTLQELLNRALNNSSFEYLASAARTADVNGATLQNYGYKGAIIVLDATAASATPSVTPIVEGYDPTSDKYYAILTGAAITGISTNKLVVYPGMVAGTNIANHPLPEKWRVTFDHADADSITYSVGVSPKL